MVSGDPGVITPGRLCRCDQVGPYLPIGAMVPTVHESDEPGKLIPTLGPTEEGLCYCLQTIGERGTKARAER